MPGIRATYTMRTADVVVQYAPDPRCIAVGFLPTGTINGVYLIAHGGGWIAQTNSNSWKHDPTYELTDPEALFAEGIAVYWLEYPYGWQAVASSRYYPCSRYPQIPRFMGMAVQYLKTHAADGAATGSTSITLPTADNAYWFNANSAGSIMAAIVALQPDGWLPYDPAGIPSLKGRFSYTYSHRVGGAFCYDCATDLRRYDGSPSAMPYFGPSSAYYGSPITAITDTDALTFDKFWSIDASIKYGASPISLAEKRYTDNLNVSLLLSNSIGISESSFLDSGIIITYNESVLTGGHPAPGQTVTAGGGATGTLRLDQDRGVGNYQLHIDANAGAGDLVANWSGTLTFSGGSTITGVDPSPGAAQVYGNDDYRTFLTATQHLAIWDVNVNDRLYTVTEHSASYLPAFMRERDAHFAAAGLTTIDNYFCGNQYTATISGYTDTVLPYRAAAFPWNDLASTDIELEILAARGVI